MQIRLRLNGGCIAICMLPLMFMLVASSLATETEEKRKLTDEQLWSAYYDFITKVKPYSLPVEKAEHANKIKPTMRHYDCIDDFTMAETHTIIRNPKDIKVTIDSYSGEIRSFFLKRYSPMTPIHGAGKNMKFDLTEAEVKKIAEKYLFLNKEIPLKEYSTSISNTYGDWFIIFSRKKDNYFYERDLISMDYSEKYGLINYHNALFSDECDTKAKIEKGAAIELSKKALLSVLRDKRLDINDFDRSKISLLIVNPNYIKANHDVSELKMSELRKTRLAWKAFISSRQYLAVIYIDALNGELINASLESIVPY